MFKLATAACIMLVFANSAHALDTAAPVTLTLESVPPPSALSQQAALPAPDTTVPVLPLAESNAPKYRPVIVVHLQLAEPIFDPTAENMAPRPFDANWENRRQYRLARFMELAARNAASPKVVPQI